MLMLVSLLTEQYTHNTYMHKAGTVYNRDSHCIFLAQLMSCSYQNAQMQLPIQDLKIINRILYSGPYAAFLKEGLHFLEQGEGGFVNILIYACMHHIISVSCYYTLALIVYCTQEQVVMACYYTTVTVLDHHSYTEVIVKVIALSSLHVCKCHISNDDAVMTIKFQEVACTQVDASISQLHFGLGSCLQV